MSTEINTMLSDGTIELCLGNKGFFTYLLIIPKKNGLSCIIINLNPLNQFITCAKLKMTTLKQIRETVQPGTLDIKSAYFHIPIRRRHHGVHHVR